MVTDEYMAAIAPTSRTNPTPWTRVQDKVFEKGLVVFPEGTPNRWARIAEHVGKTASEVREHYEALLHDVSQIDSGHVEVPNYADESYSAEDATIPFGSGRRKGGENTERKKGVPWTEEEHRLFLIGLQKYGKGDWRSISRNAVVSRTPTQVASHAQKYYLRLNSGKKEKKRSSIHDMTTDQNEPNWGDPSSTGLPKLVNGAYLQQTGQGSYGYHQHLGYPM